MVDRPSSSDPHHEPTSDAQPNRLHDRPVPVSIDDRKCLAHGWRDYERFHFTYAGADGQTITHTREMLRVGRVVGVLAVDPQRDTVVLIRQFRLPAHLANGRGELVEIVAGRAEPGERPADTARRECREEIGVAPTALVELFSYLTTPGLTDEEVTLFLAAVDSARVPERTQATEDEQIGVMRVPIDAALAALNDGTMRNGPLVIAL